MCLHLHTPPHRRGQAAGPYQDKGPAQPGCEACLHDTDAAACWCVHVVTRRKEGRQRGLHRGVCVCVQDGRHNIPEHAHGMGSACAMTAACWAPFLLNSGAALLPAGRVSARARRQCVCLGAGVSGGVGEAACGLTMDALAGLVLPETCGVGRFSSMCWLLGPMPLQVSHHAQC